MIDLTLDEMNAVFVALALMDLSDASPKLARAIRSAKEKVLRVVSVEEMVSMEKMLDALRRKPKTKRTRKGGA